jgi:type IV secretion system protein VirB10
MMAKPPVQDEDPRLAPENFSAAWAESLQPRVSRDVAMRGPWLILGVAVLLGLIATLWMASHRPKSSSSTATASAGDASTPVTVPPAPPDLTAVTAPPAAPLAANAFPAPASPLPPIMAAPPLAPSLAQTGRAPVLVVDFSPVGAPEASSGAPASARGLQAPGTNEAGLNADERFVARIEGGPEPAKASATMLRNQAVLIPQGTTIPAVLETALDSDLPGYTRAVVSRDVRGFDGSTILIPRGSRVIGEYRSAVSQGQTRAFVIWTRVIRPDGASIQIGSGGGDTLGRAGLSGRVDTHFIEEFSGAVLLTALSAGASAAAGVPSTEVVIGSGSSGAAGGIAAPFAAFAPVNIPPTIKVAQGTPILIFVQRDLDFANVGAGK